MVQLDLPVLVLSLTLNAPERNEYNPYTSPTGGNQPHSHNNTPPYYALIYMIRT